MPLTVLLMFLRKQNKLWTLLAADTSYTVNQSYAFYPLSFGLLCTCCHLALRMVLPVLSLGVFILCMATLLAPVVSDLLL